MTSAHNDDAVWVRTQPSTSGRTYVVTIDFTPDLSRTIKPTEAAEYAADVLGAAMQAAHDAAVFRQLLELGLDRSDAIGAVQSLRDDRAQLRFARAPIELRPAVNSVGTPFVTVLIAGEPAGQWSVEDARNHAGHVLDAVHAANLDAAYYRYLTGTVGVEEPTARAAVAGLARSLS